MCNPDIVARLLQESFMQMSSHEYEEKLAETKKRVLKFIQNEQKRNCTGLSIEDETTYANYVRTFLTSYEDFKQFSLRGRDISAIFHAQVLAWWQVLSTFRSLKGQIPIED